MPVYHSLAESEAHATHIRNQILSAAGLMPLPERAPLNPQIFDRIEREGYSVEKVLLQTLPGFYLGGNLYKPLGKTGKFPGVASHTGIGHTAVWRILQQYRSPAAASTWRVREM